MIDRLREKKDLPDADLKKIIECADYDQQLFANADAVRRIYYGADVYIRGLIEVSNYCKNNCYYCGIRKDNQKLERYRLNKEQILSCCETGYVLGFRTFVMQGGEDPAFSDNVICEIVTEIKSRYGDCAVTLSLGEKSFESYKLFFDAGADRYLLRHESANADHYRTLHPDSMSLENRKTCLFNLKKIGFQTGSGFMVGSPFQSTDHIIEDLRFLQELKPDMIGIGPYVTHNNTPFREHKSGDLHLCLRLIAILRLMFPNVLLPATTALGTIDVQGRELGLKAGANVVMPNLSPVQFRKQYELYENKICTSEEAAESKSLLEEKVSAAGYQIVTAVGNVKKTSF